MSTPKPATVPPPDPKAPWTGWVAITAAALAALAAISAMFTQRHTTEAMIDQVEASNSWSYYQAKGIKLTLAEQRAELAAEDGKPVPEATAAKVKRYQEEQTAIRAEAENHQKHAQDHRRRAGIIANSATLAQVSIALSAISLLTKRKVFWAGSLLGGVGGLAFLAYGHFSAGLPGV